MKKIFMVYLLSMCLSVTHASEIEHRLQLVERISNFVKWPKTIEKSFKIGIYGDSYFYKTTKRHLSTKKIHGLPVEVYRISDASDQNIDNLQLLYFASSWSGKMHKVLDRALKNPILNMGSGLENVYRGVGIGLYFREKKIKLAINNESLKSSGLKASYKLLKLSKLVKDRK